MATALPIRPVAVDVVGVDPNDNSALLVEVHLNRTPSARWSDLFGQLGVQLLDPRASQTSLDGPVVVLTSRDRDMDKQLQALERLIRHTNARLQDEDSQQLPAVKATMRMSQAIAQESMSPDIRRRLEAAKRKARTMTGVFESSHWEVVEVTPLEALALREAKPSRARADRDTVQLSEPPAESDELPF